MKQKRNLSFDLLKGFLIILVITGHILPGKADDGLRGDIYYFHMPLFLAITGYFIKTKNLEQKSTTLLIKYKSRLLTPYIIAFVAYTLCNFYFYVGINKLQTKDIISSVIYPFYHLWYIPAVLIFIFYTKFIYISNKFVFITFVASAIVSITWYAYGDYLTNTIPLLKYIGDKRFYYYYSFFLMGYMLGNCTITSMKPWVSLAICIIAILLNSFIDQSPLFGAILWYLFNISLINLTINICKKPLTINANIITKLGETSLPVYLWHVAIIILVTRLTDNNSSFYYIEVIFLTIALIAFSILSKNKFKLLDKYYYGEPTQADNK